MPPPRDSGVSLERILLDLIGAVERTNGAACDNGEDIRKLSEDIREMLDSRDERLERHIRTTIEDVLKREDVLGVIKAAATAGAKAARVAPPQKVESPAELEKRVTDIVAAAVAAAVPTAVDQRLPAIRAADAKIKAGEDPGRITWLMTAMSTFKTNPFAGLALLILVTMLANAMGMGYIVAWYVPAAAEHAAKVQVDGDVEPHQQVEEEQEGTDATVPAAGEGNGD